MTRKQVVKAYARWAKEVKRQFGDEARPWLPSWCNDGDYFGFEIKVTPSIVFRAFGGVSPSDTFRKRDVIFTVFEEYDGLPGCGEYPLHSLRRSMGLSAHNDKANFCSYLGDTTPEYAAGRQAWRVGIIQDWFANQKGD